MTMWLVRLYAILHVIPFKGFLFYGSTELKSFTDILGFPMNKYTEKVSEICPFTNFCTKPAHDNYTYNSELYGPCCPQCSCNSNCFVSQDCCIDALLSTETYQLDIVNHISCHKTVANINTANRPTYMLVASCTDDLGEKISCEKTIDETTRPEDIVVVSSEDELVNFLNEDCARCHGVTDTIRWKLSARDCTDDLFALGLTGEAMFSYAMKNCTIFSQPPDGFDVSECKTSTSISIDACGDQADIELIKLCENKFVPQFDQRQMTFGVGQLSMNVFCYMCNVPKNHTFFDECYKVSVIFTPLSYILNLDLTTYEDSGDEDNHSDGFSGNTDLSKKCPENEIRDPFFGICRQFKCPFPNRAKFNNCTTPPALPEKPTLPLSFTIHIEQTVNAVELTNLDTQFKLTVEDFTRISNLTRCKFIKFKQTYYVSKSNQTLDYIIVDVEFKRTHTCGSNVLYYIYSSNEFMIDDKKTFPVFNTTVHNYSMVGNVPLSSVGLSNYSFIPEVWLYDIESYSNIDDFAIYYEYSKYYFVPMEALPCPYVHLNETEYVTLISKLQSQNENQQDKSDERKRPETKTKELIDGFISREYHTVGETKKIYFVCIGTYISLAFHSSIRQDKYPIKGIVTLTLSIPSIICIMICFVLYSKSANTRSLPSKVFRIALSNLLIAQCLFQFGAERTSLPFSMCASIGALIHFFWLSTVFSLNAFCVLVALKMHVINDGIESSMSEMIKILFFVYGLSALFVGGNVIYSNVVNETVGYGLKLCYIDEALMRLLLFALPIFCTVVVNCFVYLYIIYAIATTTSKAGRKSKDVKYATLYFRLLLLTGVAWMFGFLNEYLSSDVLDYCFIILIGGQGLFFFFAFNIGRIWSKLKTSLICHESDIIANLEEKYK